MKRLRQLRGSAFILVGLMLMGVVMIGCSDTPTTLGGQFQPEITNDPDSFALLATDVTDIITTRTYTWSNSGTQATISFTATIQNGTANVVIKDADDTVVYNKALTRDFSEPTSAGVAGDWTIVLTLGNLSGTMEFTAEKL